MPAPAPRTVDQVLRQAIGQAHLIRFLYQRKERIAEPHDYGIQKGVAKLLAYQIAGKSSGKIPNWRWFERDQIIGIEILDQTFPGGRPAPSGQHHQWDELFIRVKASRS